MEQHPYIPIYNISKDNTLAIKGIAIIAMLLHHLFYTHPEYGLLVQQIGLIGKVCVAMFLFLSGYGLTIQYAKQQQDVKITQMGGVTVNFIYRRFVKFYMNYWVIFLIFVPIGVFCFGRTLNIPYGEDANVYKMLIKDMLGLNSLQSYNITWWFNALIIKLYFLFPLFYLFLSSRNKLVTALMLLATYPTNAFPFTLGIVIALNIDSINSLLGKFNSNLILAAAVLLTLITIVIRQLSPIPYTNGTHIDGFISLFAALTIVTAAQMFHYSFPALGFLGKHSMNMYLVHTFIKFYFFPEFIYGFKYPILIFLALLATSLLTSIIIEQLKRIMHYNVLITKLSNIKL